MKLDELIEALAAEVEAARPRLEGCLEELASLDGEAPQFMDALEQYSGQAQRMGEAAEMAGFPGLQAVCNHVLENTFMVALLPPGERAALLEFLRGWPPLMAFYLRNVSDPSAATGLVDHLVKAPHPLQEDQSLKIMHMLGAIPQQVLPGGAGSEPPRPVLATPDDVALAMPPDVDQKLLEGFFHEAPEQARYLVQLARNMVAGQGDSSDLVAARRVVHTLKGSGAIIGLRGLASLGHHFEDILDHFERSGGRVARAAADTLLDAAYCLEQMVGYVTGADEAPQQARAVLQRVLDLANRIDRGESLEVALERDEAAAQEPPAAADPVRPAGPTAAPGAALRVGVEQVEELFRLSGEVSVHSAAMEAHLKQLQERARELLAQNLRVQKRLFELETAVDAPRLAAIRSRQQAEAGFDALEMNQYSELHGTTHALMEEASDARVLAQRLEDGLSQLGGVQLRQARLARDLQHLVTGTRMTGAGTIESRLQRNVRSTCQATGKQAVLVLEGGDTRIDADVLARLTEPLLHVLRNAVDHGLEFPQERAAAGKDPAGRIRLSFARQGQQVVLRCSDDGRGLDLDAIRRRAAERGLVDPGQPLPDEEASRLILLPGFSTSDAVSEVSGRGIGLDVVREWAAGMGGTVGIESRPGQGCTLELRFAASLSTIHSLVVAAAGQHFALPSQHVEQALPRGAGSFEPLGDRLVYRHGKRVLPARRLAEACALAEGGEPQPLAQQDAVLVRVDRETVALAVDRLVDSRELLVKNPGPYARHLRGVVGLSILGDGSIAVNLDLAQLLAAGGPRQAVPAASVPALPKKALPGVLVVDDALSVRNTLVQLVQDAGFRAASARDGMDAIEALRVFRPDVVLTDLEMPNMNGIELTSHIRGRDDLKGLPVIMITSRSQEKHRRLAREAGVDRYITKPYNDGDLLETIRQAIAA